jgi:ubiquinol-cytochrome c reductase cytochrome c subunit
VTRASFARFAFLALIGARCLLAVPPAGAQGNEPTGNADNGRRLYIRTGCYQCHGREAQGSPATGPRLGPSASPYRTFEASVRRPRGEMPPYTTRVLPDAGLADIYAFVRSRPRPADPSRLPR